MERIKICGPYPGGSHFLSACTLSFLVLDHFGGKQKVQTSFWRPRQVDSFTFDPPISPILLVLKEAKRKTESKRPNLKRTTHLTHLGHLRPEPRKLRGCPPKSQIEWGSVFFYHSQSKRTFGLPSPPKVQCKGTLGLSLISGFGNSSPFASVPNLVDHRCLL